MARWYKRDGAAFIQGTMGLPLEEKGAYSICLDLIYSNGGPIADDARWLSGVCGVSLRKWSAIRVSLISRGKLFAEGGLLNAPIIGEWGWPDSRDPISSGVREEVFERDGERCRYCGGTDGPFHLDHVFPASKGGPSVPTNLVVACAPCNLSKGAKLLEEWLH